MDTIEKLYEGNFSIDVITSSVCKNINNMTDDRRLQP
jgi:hypothetical protein